MHRRSILPATERDNLLALPDAKYELIRFTPSTKLTCRSLASIAGRRTGWASSSCFANRNVFVSHAQCDIATQNICEAQRCAFFAVLLSLL